MEFDNYILPLGEREPEFVGLLLEDDVLNTKCKVLHVYDKELNAVYLLYHLINNDETLILVYSVGFFSDT